MIKLKIGYFADGLWSHKALTMLLLDETIQLRFICARFDLPDPVLRAMALENGIDFLTNPKINSAEFIERMVGYNCDLFVSMSFNQIFRKELMNIPPLKTINCHAGKLPFYRGRNILNWVLINDEKEFGITVHYVDEGIDTGNIIQQSCYPITDADDYATLLERAYDGCAVNLYDAIKSIQANRARSIVQKDIHPFGFYCTTRKAGDEHLVWNQRSREVFNFVRALCRPGPEARTFCNDQEIKINKVIFLPDAPDYKGIPGAVVAVESNAFFVKTADSYIKVIDWSGSVRPRMGDRLT
ncbi:methionyl-tRNA formyltransferase [Chlorobium sp. BLA1]|uniref:methionyl-tRNA formyltransferase n=1 Tax=Candidatus Chlorobium masyuteum TaxID=2716876 RepID=UPI0014228DE6|nr:formyltransferase family protein [Candidatus Chlorobium masyuteum]NHQ59218.1 methionyl-tRNA formyltransferase [Candidatus Chlorobium masyuteum]